MPPVKGQRQERGIERRRQILEVSLDLFGRRGYNGTALADIAAAVGITQPTILHYFGSKENLLIEVLEEREHLDDARRPAAVAGIVDGLRRQVEIAELIESDPGLTRLFSVLVAENLDASGVLHKYFVRRYRRLRDMLANGLREAQERGEVRSDLDPALKAVEIVAFMDGAQTQWLLDPRKVSLVDAYRSYTDSLLGDLQR